MFVYLESLDDYTAILVERLVWTDMVRSSYANKLCIHVCEFHRSGTIVAHQGFRYHEPCLRRHVVAARQDENGYNFSCLAVHQMELCRCNSLMYWSILNYM